MYALGSVKNNRILCVHVYVPNTSRAEAEDVLKQFKEKYFPDDQIIEVSSFDGRCYGMLNDESKLVYVDGFWIGESTYKKYLKNKNGKSLKEWLDVIDYDYEYIEAV